MQPTRFDLSRGRGGARLLAATLVVVALGVAASPAAADGHWEETRFRTGCDPGPFRPPPAPLPGVPLRADPSAEAVPVHLRVDLASAGRSLLGSGLNLEHTLWSCPDFRPVFWTQVLAPLRPAIVRVDTGALPAAPPELRADELGWEVYQAVLASAPYAESWEFLRELNRAGVPLVLGVWGGPAQFTHNGDRWGELLPRHYDDYVEYVVAVVDFIVRRQGVRAWAVTIANEPDGGDGNRVSPQGLAYLAVRLAERLRPYGVGLYGPDTASARHALDYLPALLDDPRIAEALAFVGFHQYYPSREVYKVVDYVRARRPELPVIVTEYTSFVFGDLDAGQEASDPLAFTLDIVATALSHYSHGVDAALYWDAVDYLQPGRDAITRWGLLRGPADGFAPRLWYYAMLQVLPHLAPGAQVLESRQEGGSEVTSLAVRSAEGGLAIIAVNQGAAPADLWLEVEGPGLGDEATLSVVRTDAQHRAEGIGQLRLAGGRGWLSLPGASVTTLVSLPASPE